MIKLLMILQQILLSQAGLEIFEKPKAKVDTLKREEKEKVEEVRENNFGIKVEKDLNNYVATKAFLNYKINGIEVENIFCLDQKNDNGKITNLEGIFGISYRNSKILFDIAEKKLRQEIKEEAYYNFLKSNEVFNSFIVESKFENGKILFGINVDNPFIVDITKNTSIESFKDTIYDNDVKIIRDYTITTQTEVSSNSEILNALYFFGIGYEKKFKVREAKNSFAFTLANLIPETKNNLKQIINSNVKAKGYIFVETPSTIDTILVDEEENTREELNKKERLREYNVLPILNFQSKHDLYFANLVFKKLITPNNKINEDIYGSLDLGFAVNNFYPYISFGYDNSKMNLETKLYVLEEKNKDKLREELEKVVGESKNIKYCEVYLPENYFSYKLDELELKENRAYKFMIGGKVSQEDKKIKAYGEVGYGKKPYAIKIMFGNESGLTFSYKDFDFALKYLYHIKDKEEKISVILQYRF
jgi:hypothetical protein